MNDQLPKDLTDLGWKLIDRDGRLFAISTRWGGTVPSTDTETVIRNARAMTKYIQWRMEQEARRVENASS